MDQYERHIVSLITMAKLLRSWQKEVEHLIKFKKKENVRISGRSLYKTNDDISLYTNKINDISLYTKTINDISLFKTINDEDVEKQVQLFHKFSVDIEKWSKAIVKDVRRGRECSEEVSRWLVAVRNVFVESEIWKRKIATLDSIM